MSPFSLPQLPSSSSLVRGSIGDGEHLSVRVFVFFMELLIAVMTRMGGAQAFVCWVVRRLKEAGILFTGDTLFAGSAGRTDLPGGDWETLLESLGRLAWLEGDAAVHPGHGPSTTLSEERAHNPFLRAVRG